MMDIQEFRLLFPEFSSETRYPDASILTWAGLAELFVKEGWALSGDAYAHALKLGTAHFARLSSVAALSGSSVVSGAGGGQGIGAVQSASEGGVSVSFVAPPVRSAWHHWLSQTPYGQQLWALLSLAGAGGAYVGGVPERQGFRKGGGIWG